MESQEQNHQICPWCQTEIVWDPEFGPEKECPHCLNDLNDYRTINLNLKSDEPHAFHDADDDEADEDEGDQSERLDDYDEDRDAPYRDEYEIHAEQCVDSQEEAPECGNCRELMLLAGHRTVREPFTQVVPASIGQPFLTVPYQVDIYVCPACFKTDEFLSEDSRQAMIDAIKHKK